MSSGRGDRWSRRRVRRGHRAHGLPRPAAAVNEPSGRNVASATSPGRNTRLGPTRPCSPTGTTASPDPLADRLRPSGENPTRELPLRSDSWTFVISSPLSAFHTCSVPSASAGRDELPVRARVHIGHVQPDSRRRSRGRRGRRRSPGAAPRPPPASRRISAACSARSKLRSGSRIRFGSRGSRQRARTCLVPLRACLPRWTSASVAKTKAMISAMLTPATRVRCRRPADQRREALT